MFSRNIELRARQYCSHSALSYCKEKRYINMYCYYCVKNELVTHSTTETQS